MITTFFAFLIFWGSIAFFIYSFREFVKDINKDSILSILMKSSISDAMASLSLLMFGEIFFSVVFFLCSIASVASHMWLKNKWK